MCCTALPRSCHGGWDLEYIHPNYDISSFVFNLLGQTAPRLLFMICHSCNSPAEVIALSLRWFGVRNAWVNSTVNVERSRRGERGWYLLCPFYSWGAEARQWNNLLWVWKRGDGRIKTATQLFSIWDRNTFFDQYFWWQMKYPAWELVGLKISDIYEPSPAVLGCIGILEVRAALLPPRSPSPSQTSQIYYLWGFCLDSSCRSIHR